MKNLNKPKSERKDPGFESRNLALSILLKIDNEKSYANLALPAELRKHSLEPRDSAFVTELVYGTIRMQLLYDQIITSAAGRALTKIDSVPLHILRLTAHQLLALHTPPHAAVDSAVRLTVRNRHGSASGFINAVSRRISERNTSQWLEALSVNCDAIDALALEFSHPRWIVEAYLRRLEDLDAVRRELQANNLNPRITGVIYPGNEWSVSTLEASEPCEWVLAARYLRGNPENIVEITDRSAGIQDQGSYLAAQALALAPTTSDTPRVKTPIWLDMCAGPGGKGALLERWAHEENARFLALEISEHRAGLMARMISAIAVGDGTIPPIAPESVTKILLDSPCSGLGALRRRPDARVRKLPSDLPALVQLQRDLLHSASELLEVGGVMAYVTCSPVFEETSGNIQWFQETHSGFELIDARPFFPASMTLDARLDVQLWPGIHHTDAMYVALLQKKSRTR